MRAPGPGLAPWRPASPPPCPLAAPGEHTDAELWNAIKEASLEPQVKVTGGLDARVSGTGSGAWSLGQQQLVCLARAYLRQVPVLCLDEATAAMDPQTEQEVQAVIKRVFESRTIITIAHRLDTVIESDKVLVMVSQRGQPPGHAWQLCSSLRLGVPSLAARF